MNVHLVSFSTCIEDIGFPDIEGRQIRLIKSAEKYGINRNFTWNRRKLLRTKFYKDNKGVLDMKKGAGYWLWKPYIILDALKRVRTGDIIFYADNGFYFIHDPSPLVKLAYENKGIYLTAMGQPGTLGNYSKQRAIELMGFQYESMAVHSAVSAGIQIYVKNEFTMSLAEEYLKWCSIPEILLDDEVLGLQPLSNRMNFKWHTHDQCVMSCLRIKYQLNGYRAPYQHGNHQKMAHLRIVGEDLLGGCYEENEVFYNSDYPTIMIYDKEGLDCRRPKKQYLNPVKVYGYLRRKLQAN